MASCNLLLCGRTQIAPFYKQRTGCDQHNDDDHDHEHYDHDDDNDWWRWWDVQSSAKTKGWHGNGNELCLNGLGMSWKKLQKQFNSHLLLNSTQRYFIAQTPHKTQLVRQCAHENFEKLRHRLLWQSGDEFSRARQSHAYLPLVRTYEVNVPPL